MRINISWKLNFLGRLLPECSIANRSRGSWSMHSNLLLGCHGSYRSTINGRLLTDHTNYTCQFEIWLQVRPVHEQLMVSVWSLIYSCVAIIAACSGLPPLCSTFSSSIMVDNLSLMVDICLRCNQMLYYWKMPLLTGNIQWCCTILEVKNTWVIVLYNTALYPPTHVTIDIVMKV